MFFARALMAVFGSAGVVVGVLLAVLGSIALGPFFWVPFVIFWLALRWSGLTPKTFHKKKPQPWAVAAFGQPPERTEELRRLAERTTSPQRSTLPPPPAIVRDDERGFGLPASPPVVGRSEEEDVPPWQGTSLE